MGDNLDIGSSNVGVLVDEMSVEDTGEELGGCNGVLLGFDVDGILHGISSHNYTVVGFGVSISS